MTKILSVCDARSNGELLAHAAALWVRPVDRLVDTTYGRGLWHTHYQHPPELLTCHDLGLSQEAVNPDGVNFCQLPEPDGSVDVVWFDPPYVASGGRETSTLAAQGSDMWDRYGMGTAPKNPVENAELIAAGVKEIARVLRAPTNDQDGIEPEPGRKSLWTPGGRLMVKAMEYVWGGHLQPCTDWIKTAARDAGLRWVDQFVHVKSGPGPQPSLRTVCAHGHKVKGGQCEPCGGTPIGVPRRQVHAHSSHTVLLVFQRQKEAEPMRVRVEEIESPAEDRASTLQVGADGHLILWGSECRRCDNATPDSMVCDNCNSSGETRALWIEQPR